MVPATLGAPPSSEDTQIRRSACSIRRSSEPIGAASPNRSQPQLLPVGAVCAATVYSGMFERKSADEKPVLVIELDGGGQPLVRERRLTPHEEGAIGRLRQAGIAGHQVWQNRQLVDFLLRLSHQRLKRLRVRLRLHRILLGYQSAGRTTGIEIERWIEEQRRDQKGHEQRENPGSDGRSAEPTDDPRTQKRGNSTRRSGEDQTQS